MKTIDEVLKDIVEVRVFKDGLLWCAVTNDFTNLQESAAGFGLTPDFAVKELVDYMRGTE